MCLCACRTELFGCVNLDVWEIYGRRERVVSIRNVMDMNGESKTTRSYVNDIIFYVSFFFVLLGLEII